MPGDCTVCLSERYLNIDVILGSPTVFGKYSCCKAIFRTRVLVFNSVSWWLVENILLLSNSTRFLNLLAFRGNSVCLSRERPHQLLSVYSLQHMNTRWPSQRAVSADVSRGGHSLPEGNPPWLAGLQKLNYASSKNGKPNQSWHRPLRDSAEFTTKTSHFIPATLGTCRTHRSPFKILQFSIFIAHHSAFHLTSQR